MHIWADSQETSYYYYSTIKHTSSNIKYFCRNLRLFSHHQFSNIPSVMLYFSLSSPQSTIVITITIYQRQGNSQSGRKNERQHVTILQRVTNPSEALLFFVVLYYVVLRCVMLCCILSSLLLFFLFSSLLTYPKRQSRLTLTSQPLERRY